MKLTDQDVVNTLKSGGPRVHKVLDYIYLKSRKKIIRYVMKNGGSNEDGQDVLQDAISAFYHNVINNKYRGESDIDGYIYGIARNTWLKSLKSKDRMKVFQDTGHKEESSKELDFDEDIIRHLDKVMENMNDRCREILVHAFYYNYSAEELSEKFEFKNEQVARNKKYKCLKRLREMMSKFKNL